MSATFTFDTTKLDQIIKSLPESIDAFVGGCAESINQEIKDSFGESPSAPGDPPGVDTGALKRSMRAYKDRKGHVWIVAANVEYAPYLEFGTSKMAARPFFIPVFHRWQRRLVDRAVDFGLVS